MATSSILHAVYEHTNAPTEILNSTASILLMSPVDTQNAAPIIQEQINVAYSVGSIEIHDTTITQAPTDTPLSYDDKLKFPAQYSWNEAIQLDISMPHQSYHTTLMIGVLIALIFLLFIFCRRKQQKNPKFILHPYLVRFRTKDVHIRRSPLGGWNVEFGKELYNQVLEYWSGELPDLRDSGTIVFNASLGNSNMTSPCDSESGGIGSVSSSGDSHPWWQIEVSSLEEEHEKMVDITSCTGRSSSLVDAQRKSKLLKVGISQFVRRQFEMDDIVLKESPTNGWSAAFCNRLAEGINDADCDEILDFSSSHEIVLPIFPFSSSLQLPL